MADQAVCEPPELSVLCEEPKPDARPVPDTYERPSVGFRSQKCASSSIRLIAGKRAIFACQMPQVSRPTLN